MMEKQSVETILERIDEHHELLEEHHKYAQKVLEALRDDVKELMQAFRLLNCWRETGKELRALGDVFAGVYDEIKRLKSKKLTPDQLDLPRLEGAWERSIKQYNSVVLSVRTIENILGEGLLREEEAFKLFLEHKCTIDDYIANYRLGELGRILGEFNQDIENCHLYVGCQIAESVDSLREVCTAISEKITEL